MMTDAPVSGLTATAIHEHIAAAGRSEGFLSGPVFLDTGSEDVIALEVQYHLPFYRMALFDRLDVAMPKLLAEAVPKRQAEFLAGRFLGQAALTLFGHDPQPIGIGNRREPVWPSGISGSISHSHGICVCMVTQEHDVRVGVDIEKIEPGAVTEIILKRALAPLERRLIAELEECDASILPFWCFPPRRRCSRRFIRWLDAISISRRRVFSKNPVAMNCGWN